MAISSPAIALLLIAGPTAQQARRPASLVVVGGTVITENGTRQLLSPGAVAIDGTDILDVASPETIASRYNAATTIDARDQIVLPGLINTHTHAAMVMFRGLADDLALMDWLQKYIFPAEARTVSPHYEDHSPAEREQLIRWITRRLSDRVVHRLCSEQPDQAYLETIHD